MKTLYQKYRSKLYKCKGDIQMSELDKILKLQHADVLDHIKTLLIISNSNCDSAELAQKQLTEIFFETQIIPKVRKVS